MNDTAAAATAVLVQNLCIRRTRPTTASAIYGPGWTIWGWLWTPATRSSWWERRLLAAGVPCSPIQDMPLGHHLNFTDPVGIALELQAPNDVYRAVLVELRSTKLSDDQIRAQAAAMLP